MRGFFFTACLFVSCTHTPPQDLPIFPQNENSEIEAHTIAHGSIEQNIELIQKMEPSKQKAHINHLALQILNEGAASDDAVSNLLTLYGAAFAINDDTLPIFEKLLSSPYPRMQLACVLVLSTLRSEEAFKLLEKALGSDFIEIRLEALFTLVENHTPNILDHLNALYERAPPEARSLFAELYQKEGSDAAKIKLRKMFYDPDLRLRIDACKALLQNADEEQASLAKSAVTDSSPAIQELALDFLSTHKDLSLTPQLKEKVDAARHSLSIDPSQLLAAHVIEENLFIEQEAKQKNLFAISLLGRSERNIPLLQQLCGHEDVSVRLNAAIQLLHLKNSSSLFLIEELFMFETGSLLEKVYSPGKALFYYTVTDALLAKDNMDRREASKRNKEELAIIASELPEEDFLLFSSHIFASHRKDFIPLICRLLENIRSPQAIQLLEYESEHPGSPFIRTYAQLMLFRINPSKTSEKPLVQWIKANASCKLLDIRPMLFWTRSQRNSEYTLTFEETSQLYVDIMTTFVETKNDQASELLLHLIQHGTPCNRYLLAGLLLRCHV